MPRGRIRSWVPLLAPLLACVTAASCEPAEVPEGRRRALGTVDEWGVLPVPAAGDDRSAGGDLGYAAVAYRDEVRPNGREPKESIGGVPEQTVKGRSGPRTTDPTQTERFLERETVPSAPEPVTTGSTTVSGPVPVVTRLPNAVESPGVPRDQEPLAQDVEKANGHAFARRPPTGEAESAERPEGALELMEGGGVSPEVRRLLRGQQAALQRCYDALQLRSPGAGAGMVTIRLTLDPAGQVQSVEIVGGTIDEAEFNRCVLDHLRRLSFPRADSAATVTWPFRFGSGPVGASE